MSIEFSALKHWRSINPRNLQGIDSLGLGVAVLIPTLAAVFLILPMSQNVRELEHQLESETRFLRRASLIRVKHQNTATEHRAQNEKLARLLTLVPSEPNAEKFLAEISVLAQTSELELQQFQPENAIQNARYREIPIHLAASGSYQATCRFLHGLQELSRLTEVLRLRLSPESSGNPHEMASEETALLLDLDVKIYYQTDGEAKR